MAEIQKKKQESRFHLQQKLEAQGSQLTFTPELNDQSYLLAERKKKVSDVTTRLMQDASEKMERQSKAAEIYQEHLGDICTFQPNIQPLNQSVDELLASNELYKSVPDFVTRQNLLSDQQKQRKRALLSKSRDSRNCTFSPEISRISEFLVESNPDRLQEAMPEKLNRLSKQVIVVLVTSAHFSFRIRSRRSSFTNTATSCITLSLVILLISTQSLAR